MALNVKQSRFVAEYLVDLNATQACIRAGYSAKTAGTNGPRLLANARIRKEIDAAVARRAERVEVKTDDVLRELLRLARSDVGQAFAATGDLLPVHEMPEDTRRAIAAVEIEQRFTSEGEAYLVKKVKFWDKTKGLELLGKHLKLFTDKVEHSVSATLEQLIMGSLEKPK